MVSKFYNKKYLLGDIHGYWSIISNHLVQNDEKNIGYIQVGDFGIGFYENEPEKLKKLDEILDIYDSDIYIIRGNHDNPAWFINGGNDKISDIKSNLKRIIFVPDYTTININTENILFVGGAVSIDRVPRMMDLTESWWSNEVFKLDEEKLEGLSNIDRIITHTCPDFCEPIKFNQLVYNYASQDSNLLKDLREERELVTKMSNILMLNGKNPKLKGWYYGHFHNNYRFLHQNMEFVCLDINRFMQF
jgi:hypothetical protein